MRRKSFLEKQAEQYPDYHIYSIFYGLPAPYNKNSKLYKAMGRARNAGYQNVIYVVGERKRIQSQGYRLAVLVK